MRARAALLVLSVLCCASNASAFLSINTDKVSSASTTAVKPYLRIREVQRGTTGNPREDGSDLQHIAVSFVHRTRTNPSVTSIPVDSIDHLDSGLYRVAYTPIVSGLYDASITIKGGSISTDLSNGLTIQPARADAIKSTHTASPLVTEGIDETFAIQAIDRYGNELWSELTSKEDEFLVDLEGAPHGCSGREGETIAHPVAILEYAPEVDAIEDGADGDEYSGGGLYKASYSPTLAGTHQVSIRLRSVGGLLGTYFRNADFTGPVWGNANHILNSHPAHVPWCEPDVVKCDSTRLDSSIMFDWGFGPPLRQVPPAAADDDDDDNDDDKKFPIDNFSAQWVGELQVPATDEYTFHITLNGQAKLVVGESILIDTISRPAQSKTVSSETIELDTDTFYPITVEYIHHNEEALIQLEWSSWSIAETEAVPPSAFYYTRHLGNYDGNQVTQNNNNYNNNNSHPSSPFPVEVLPGAIDLTSSSASDVEGDEEDATTATSGLNTCVAMTECSFVIQTKDSTGNNRYNDGTDPAFVLSMTGVNGWAGEGRVNDDLAYSTKPLEVSPLSSVPLDWQYLDMVEVVHGSNRLTTASNLLLKGLKRGDVVIVGGQTYTVSTSMDKIFDETTVPLDEAIIGPSMPSAPLYKAGSGCNTGKHIVTYTPQVRGEYKLDVRLPPVPEVQRIQMLAHASQSGGPGDDSASASVASGTFTLTYRSSDGNMQTTADISYDANVDELKEALESLSNLSTVEFGLDAYSCIVEGDPSSGCWWDVTFVGPELEGDIELLMPNDVDLVGATVVVTELRAGISARSISGFPRTVTVLPDAIDPAWTTAHGQGLVLATAGVEAEFTIQTKDGAGNDLLSNVDNPDDLFQVTITPEDGNHENGNGDVNAATIVGIVTAEDDGRYRVSYTPTMSGHHAINVVIKSMTGEDDKEEESFVAEHIKKSPFRVLVDPGPINATNSVANDSPGVIHHQGLSAGVYGSQTYFSIQLHDEFDNKVSEGPQSEVQVIEMWSLSPMGGTFDISHRNNKVTVPASAGIAQVERAIQTLPGLGDVSVTTNAAKDTVVTPADGRTAAVTTGLDTLIPSQRLDDEFSEGDWIRIGSRDDGPVFSIVAMSTAAPFTVTLSSAYMGESDSAAAIYGQSLHGPPFGFQYIVSFDPTLGDVEALEVDGINLDGGDDTTIHVTSCDHNAYQTIETHAHGAADPADDVLPSISGTFYLSYKGQRTPDLSASIDAASLEAIIEETFSSILDGGIQKVTVLQEVDLERGAKRWDLRLDDYDDAEPSLLFAEGHLLSSGSIAVTAVCPIASSDDYALEAPSQAGRSGQEFNIALIATATSIGDPDSQSSVIHGQANHVADGLFAASYKSPRVGEYELHINTALSGGLYGQYYNNRWLFGPPFEERVDKAIDFVWTDVHPINENIGNEFISVRWAGYIKAAFNEVYSFRMRVNDGARLWIGEELIIDEYDSTVVIEEEGKEGELYRLYQGTTTIPLETSRLTAIKIEYQQNRGDANIRLEWSSETQPWSVVESYRLYHEGRPVDESPYIVRTWPVAPTEPRNCSAVVTGAKAIQIQWMRPEDDGGEDVRSYRVVAEDVDSSSTVFDETLLVQDLVDMMSMASYDDDATSLYYLDIGKDKETIPLLIAGKQYSVQVSAGNTQDDFGPFCQQVLVTPMSEPMAVKTVLLERHPTSPTSLIVSFEPVVEERANGSEISHYRIEWSTDASFSYSGETTTTATVKEAALLSSSHDVEKFLLYEIQALEPGQEYHVRVTAINSVGAGPPSSMPASLAPGSEPEPIEQNRFVLRVIEASGDNDDGTNGTSVVTVGESSTSLLASWPSHSIHHDNGFAVEKYVLEYHVASEDAQPSSAMEPTRIKRIEVDADANNYTLTDLSPGQPISAKIYAKNVLGMSTATVAIPDELAPPRQPPSEPTNVQLNRIIGGGGGGGSLSSLSVVWDPPGSDGGDAISKYLVEYSTDEDFSPSSVDFGAYTKVDCEDKQQCRHTILGLAEGTSYYVRVFAGNSYGFSRTALSHPKSLAPMSQPGRLDRVNIAMNDDDHGQHVVNVSWQRRGDESGGVVSPTTAYKVEWVETNLYQDYTTQRIQASGSFRLSFQGHKTKLLAVDSSAYKIKQALESLPTIGSVEVLKDDVLSGIDDNGEGPTHVRSWLATFPHFRHMEKIEIEHSGISTGEADSVATVEYVVEAYEGYEVQSVKCEQCLDAAARQEQQSFRLSYLGNATATLPLSITPSALESALREIGVGEVEVSRRTDHSIRGYEWKVAFKSLLGDLPLLQTIVDPHSGVHMYVGEIAKGQLPSMMGSSYGSLVLSSKEAEAKADANGWIHWDVEFARKRKPYYFQVSASNEVGFGPAMYSTPSSITI